MGVTALDYQQAFEMAPVGLVVSHRRMMVDCNEQVCAMFHTSRELMIGQSFQILYPSADEFERLGRRIAPIMGAQGLYSDNRIMKRANGEVFWCHVMGRAFNRADPHEGGVWSFEDLSAMRPVRAELTAREREVAARLLEGMTSKEIGRSLDISHRTVEIYRTRLMRKYGADSSAELVQKLLAGGSSLDIVLGPDEA